MAKRQLTPRERGVLRHIVLTGASARSSAPVLGMSVRTFKYHVSNLTEAFGVSTRSELSALIFQSIVRRLAEIEGVKWPTDQKEQWITVRGFLHQLFLEDEGAPGEAFAELPREGEFEQRRDEGREARRSKHKPKGPYDWSSVDWSRPKSEIAKTLGCSRAMVYRKASRLLRGMKAPAPLPLAPPRSLSSDEFPHEIETITTECTVLPKSFGSG